jgi:hypothetical protein
MEVNTPTHLPQRGHDCRRSTHGEGARSLQRRRASPAHSARRGPAAMTGRNRARLAGIAPDETRSGGPMNGIIYLVGLIVIVLAILSFLGLR